MMPIKPVKSSRPFKFVALKLGKSFSLLGLSGLSGLVGCF